MATQDELRVRARAYEIWEEEGRPQGRHHEHWEQARREIEGQTREPHDVAEPKRILHTPTPTPPLPNQPPDTPPETPPGPPQPDEPFPHDPGQPERPPVEVPPNEDPPGTTPPFEEPPQPDQRQESSERSTGLAGGFGNPTPPGVEQTLEEDRTEAQVRALNEDTSITAAEDSAVSRPVLNDELSDTARKDDAMQGEDVGARPEKGRHNPAADTSRASSRHRKTADAAKGSEEAAAKPARKSRPRRTSANGTQPPKRRPRTS